MFTNLSSCMYFSTQSKWCVVRFEKQTCSKLSWITDWSSSSAVASGEVDQEPSLPFKHRLVVKNSCTYLNLTKSNWVAMSIRVIKYYLTPAVKIKLLDLVYTRCDKYRYMYKRRSIVWYLFNTWPDKAPLLKLPWSPLHLIASATMICFDCFCPAENCSECKCIKLK